MVDMERYMNKIVSKEDKIKIKSHIKLNVVVFYAYCFVGLIALYILISGAYKSFSKIADWKYEYIGGCIVGFLDVLMLYIFEHRNPINKYKLNDRILIYLYELKDELSLYMIENGKVRRFLKNEKTNFLVIGINKELYKLKQNIEGTFIYRDDNFKIYIKDIENTINVFRNIKKMKNNYSKVCNIIDIIISLYEISIINEFKKQDFQLKTDMQKSEKLKKLSESLNNILEDKNVNFSDNENKIDDKKINFKQVVSKNIITILLVVVLVGLVIIRGLSDTKDSVTIIAQFITIITATGLIKKSN